MFLHSYQSGPYFEVFDPKEVHNKGNKEKTELYSKLFKVNYPTNSTIVFDQTLKGFICEYEGHATKIQFPRKGDLGLIQQFLVVQVYLYPGYNWTLELDVTDITNTKRRIVLTDSVKTLEYHHFHLKSPIDHVRRGQWLNLCIDVWSFMEGFKGCTFRSIDTIVIGSPCKLRKIYLMKNPIEDSEIEITFTQGFMIVPKQVNFPEWFSHNNQLITFRLLNFNEFSLSQQVQSLPNNPIDRYVYDTKSQIQPSAKIGQLKYSKPENISNQQQTNNQQDFKKYEKKNIEEKLDSQDQTHNSLDSDEKNHASYFQEVEQDQDEQLEDLMGEIEQDEEYLKLVYDPQLKCFYDPETNEYYQLNQE